MWRVLLVFLPLTSCDAHLCRQCDCLPTQVICRPGESQVFNPATSEDNSKTLELIYIYSFETVVFVENSFSTKKPVTILIQNCTNVIFEDSSVELLQTLIIRDTSSVTLGKLNVNHGTLWATVLENIGQLTIDSTSLTASYSVSISHVSTVTITQKENANECDIMKKSTFTIHDCKLKPILTGDLSICGGHVTILDNTFEAVREQGLQVTTSGVVSIINNCFKQVEKEAFNLSSPEIYLVGNQFDHLPEGALRGLSSLQDADYDSDIYFLNNTIGDIDLGGVLLDMDWNIILENNFINCDCTSKRTSILNPKQDMLVLSNSSFEKLHTIFHNNFCSFNCTVSLATFSYALSEASVCLTNYSLLDQVVLCGITTPETVELATELDKTHVETQTISMFSSANRVEFIIPLGIVVLSLIVTSSVCYGCREARTFRFKFTPHTADRQLL